MVDFQALGVAAAAVITAAATLWTGIKTGTNSRVKDENQAVLEIEKVEAATRLAVEEATRVRIEALVQDAAELRKRVRASEDEFDQRERENDIRYQELRRYSQRGWDLANLHFGVLSVLAHLLNNMLLIVTMRDGGSEPTDVDRGRLWAIVENSRKRLEMVNIPTSLESPLERRDSKDKAA